jgi:hypothetical protein
MNAAGRLCVQSASRAGLSAPAEGRRRIKGNASQVVICDRTGE